MKGKGSELIDILIVCTGNLCRSPMSEALLQSKLINEYPDLAEYIEVHSAGTSAIDGNPATSSAVQAMDLWGIDLEPHRASELTPELLEGADLVLAMAREHLLYIGRIEPRALNKSTTLKHLASSSGAIISRLGDETVRDESEARSRITRVLEVLKESVPPGDFIADIQSRSSDIIDPIGSSLRVYLGVAEDIESSLEESVRVLFGRPEKNPEGEKGSPGA
jgi:protein-tyrosine phosphatase